jgi:hypothetical protein
MAVAKLTVYATRTNRMLLRTPANSQSFLSAYHVVESYA